MNKYNCDKFTEVILNTAKLKDVDEALYFLTRKAINEKAYTNITNHSKLADVILYSLKDVEFDRKIYNRNGVAKYLIKHFKRSRGLKYFLEPIINETEIMVENSLNKYEEYMESQFTEKQIKEVFINRVIWRKKKHSNYYFEKLNLENAEAIYRTDAYKILIDEYNYEYNTTVGKASEIIQKKIELINEKFDYKLKEIILDLKSKNNQKDIAKYLNVPMSLYRSILKSMGLVRERNKKINLNNIDEPALLYNKNAIIKLHIDINETEINEVETLNIEMYENLSVEEGKRKQYIHYKIERNCQIVEMAKRYFKEIHGALFCECCGKNYEEKYGELGKDYIEAHHENPLGENEGEVETKIKDFKMVCADCHRMLHRKMPCLKIEELKKIMIEVEKIKKVEG